MTYTPTKWVNGGKPAISAENLNKIEEELARLSIPDITATTSTTLPNSYAGRFKFDEIGGVTEQGENPSPTNPQEIKKSVVKGIRTHHKNFLNPSLQTTTSNGVTCTRNSDGTYTLNGTASAKAVFQVFYNKDGTFKSKRIKGLGCPIGGSDASYKGWFTDVTVLGMNDFGNGAILTPSTNELKYIIEIASGYTCSNLVFKPMITTDLEATYDDFEPYQGTEITFSQPIELYGIGDVQDVIIPKEIVRRFSHIKNNGFKAIDGYDVGASKLMALSIPDNVPNSWSYNNMYSVCNKLPAKNVIAVDENGFYVVDFVIYARIKGCSSADEFNAQMADAEFVYPIETPTTEALPIADQIGLNSLATYDGITYVEFDSEIQPTFKAEYGTSKVGGYTLEGMLAGRNGELKN